MQRLREVHGRLSLGDYTARYLPQTRLCPMYGSRIIPLNAGDIISFLSGDAHLLLGYMKLWQNASVKTKSICAFRILA